MKLVLSLILVLTAVGIGSGMVAQSRAPEAWVQMVNAVKDENPALALSSLAQTVKVLSAVADTQGQATITGWLFRHHGSRQGRHSIVLFVPTKNVLEPAMRHRIAQYGGQVKPANEAASLVRTRLASTTDVTFAVLDRYHYAAKWGRGFPPGLTRPKVFYGRRRPRIVPFRSCPRAWCMTGLVA